MTCNQSALKCGLYVHNSSKQDFLSLETWEFTLGFEKPQSSPWFFLCVATKAIFITVKITLPIYLFNFT